MTDHQYESLAKFFTDLLQQQTRAADAIEKVAKTLAEQEARLAEASRTQAAKVS